MADTEKNTARVVARKNFRQLKRAMERVEEAQKKHREWVENTCDENDWWPREWTMRTGEIKKTAVVSGKVVVVEILRAPKEITKEARKQINGIEAEDLKLGRLIEKIAGTLHVPTDAINIRTGEISVTESQEASEVNVDAPDEADEDDEGADEAPTASGPEPLE